MSERNTAIKDAISLLTGGDIQSYGQPIQTADDLLAKGLIDQNGQATSKGVLFTQMQDEGMLDESGALTEKGRAYSLPYQQTLEESELPAYIIRQQDGVDDGQSVTVGDVAQGTLDFLWNAGAGAGRALWNAASDTWKDEKGRKESEVAFFSSVEGAVKGIEEMAAIGQIVGGHSANLIGQVTGMQRLGEESLWLARQQRDKIFNDHQAAALGEVIEDYSGTTELTSRMADIKQQVGKEQFEKLKSQGEAFGQVIGDPTNLVPAAAGAKAGAKAGFVTRAALRAERNVAMLAAIDGQLAELGVQYAAKQGAFDTVDAAAKAARNIESKLSDSFAVTGNEATRSGIERAGTMAAAKEAEAAKLGQDAWSIRAKMDELTAKRQAIGPIEEAISQRIARAAEIGKQIKSAPGNIVGTQMERLGEAIVKLDDGLSEVAERSGGKAAMNIVRVGLGLAGYSMFGLPGIAVAALGSGDIIRQTGKFARVVGKEMSKARGQVPFWQRVANAPELSKGHKFLAHVMDTATLGGAGPDMLRRVGAGTLAAYPSDLLFQYLQDDNGNAADTFQQAFGKSLVLGGSSAALGGMFLGTKERHRQLSIGDERNFRSELVKSGDNDQIARYEAMPFGVRRSIATYAAANPMLNFEFAVTGASSFDPMTNTARINIAGKDPLKPLVAHEVLHNVVIKNQMEGGIAAMLIGDGQRGGLLRSADGTLDDGFSDFLAAYNARLSKMGNPPVSLKDAAVEYFIESAADRVAGMAESGELGARAGRTQIRRTINRVVDAMLPKVPVLRDLHFKMGGLMETNGNMVVGNGLLAEGLRQLPQTRKLIDQMLDRQAGRATGAFDPMGQMKGSEKKEKGGVTLPVQKGDKALLDSFYSLFETEEVNGITRVKYDKNGDPIPISQTTDAARSQIGTLIGEITSRQERDGKKFLPGEMKRERDGSFSGSFLGPDTIKAIEERGILNKEQIRMLKQINRSAKSFDGTRFTLVYHPAIQKIGKKIRYAALAPTLRDVVPYSMEITKQGNLRVFLMSVTQLHENIREMAQSKRGKDLYQGNTDAIIQDVSNVMELHHKGERTDAYFDSKYGAVKGNDHKNFINSIFGQMVKEQKDRNPLLAAGEGAKNQVIRSYRLDRISNIVQDTGETKIRMPFVYDAAKLNLFTNGVPELAK